MTPKHARYAVSAFVLLSACAAGNIMFLQDTQSGGRTQTARAQARPTAAERLKRPIPDQQQQAAAPETTSQPLLMNAQTPFPAAKAAGKPGAAEVLPAAAGPDAPEVVAAIQRELQTRGYEPGVPDGVAGAVTRAAIMAWEADHGLGPTGEPTEAIMKAIVLGVSAPATAAIAAQYQALPKDKRARTEFLVRSVQTSLSALGYNAGKATGRVNDDTIRSIREFEVDQNMVQSGRISGPLVARLTRLSGMGKAPISRP
jgi:peptidoglycan hydrolase-like protein with peptidoglycan-binding domain